MASNKFWQRSIKIMLKKYLGWEFRLIPLIGFIALVIPAFFWREYRWTDVLGFSALLVLCVCLSLSVHDVWEEDKKFLEKRINELLPLEQALRFQKDNPSQFICARFECLMVERTNTWVGSDVIIASRLPYTVEIKTVDVILQVPIGNGWKQGYDMKTRIGEQCGSVSGEAGQRDLRIRVHRDDDSEFSNRLLAYIGEHPCNWIPLVEGKVIITTNESKEIRLDIPETSIIATVVGNIQQMETENG
jgi:hypothetical protein